MHEEDNGAVDCSHKPKQHVDEVDPDGVFHADDTCVTLGVLVDVHLAKGTEEGHPEDTIKYVSKLSNQNGDEWIRTIAKHPTRNKPKS